MGKTLMSVWWVSIIVGVMGWLMATSVIAEDIWPHPEDYYQPGRHAESRSFIEQPVVYPQWPQSMPSYGQQGQNHYGFTQPYQGQPVMPYASSPVYTPFYGYAPQNSHPSWQQMVPGNANPWNGFSPNQMMNGFPNNVTLPNWGNWMPMSAMPW